MATKNEALFRRKQSFVTDNSHINDIVSQYSHLNLNQNLNSSNLSPVQSYQKSFNSNSCGKNNKKFAADPLKSYNTSSTSMHDYSVESVNCKRKEKSELWNKSSKSSKFQFLNDESKEVKKSWKKDSNATTNNSTLSLHISAYENSNEAVASDSFGIEKEFKKNEPKQIFAASSTLIIQNPFEFPRQQHSNGTDPEVSQYSASQRLFNPNGTIKDEPSEVEDNYDAVHVEQNRRGKKAGGWQILGLDHPVFKAIQKLGFRQPTPIQCKAIPPILDGKDVVAMSRTGSGKTAAFVIPMIQKLKQRMATGTRALLLSPTRELALQTFAVVKQLAKFTGLRCACVVGGDNMEEQFSAIHENPDILIATPGRLLHLAVEMNLKLNSVRYIVFDEADRLFELGFAEQLHDILKRLSESRQTMLFSATLPKILVDFAKAGLSDPTLVRLDADTKISEKLSMVFFACRDTDKASALLHLARKAVREQKQTIIFCATMKHVEYFSTILTEAGLDCCFLYSQLDASARKMNITRFRNKQCMLLVVTDVAARGVDIPLMDNAINVHFPAKSKLFVHRVGRVARAGKFGTSYSLVSPDEMPYVLDLFLFLGRPLKLAVDTDVYKVDETLMGSFPDDLVHMETEFLRNIHEVSMEVSDLKHKSDNAMKKYIRTRPPPSSESVRRAKKEFKTLECAPHPILDKSISMSADHSVLQELRNYRPQATIFELNASSKLPTVNIMKAKRKAHQRLVQKNAKDVNNDESEEEEESADEAGVIESFDNVVKVTKLNLPQDEKVAEPRKAKKRKYDEQKERDKMEHYVSYRAADDETEKGYAVDNNPNSFDALAKNSSVDIIADDDKGLYREKGKTKWDRKTKKYVGEQSVKRIRTEEGTLVPASYKSGRYEKWQTQQKMKYRNNDDEEGEDADNRGHHARSHKKVWHTKENNRRGPRDEVKRPEEIFKARRKKDKIQGYQEHRRQENLKRKIGSLQNKRSGPGSFKKGGSKPSFGGRSGGKSSFGGRSGGKPSFGGRPRGKK